MNDNLLKDIAEVTNVLSSNHNRNLKVKDFLKNFDSNFTNDKLTKKIVDINFF